MLIPTIIVIQAPHTRSAFAALNFIKLKFYPTNTLLSKVGIEAFQ